jgi:hypothetical protein
MTAGIYLERFLLLFIGVVWALYLFGVPSSYIAGMAALMLAVGAGVSLVHHRRMDT